MQVVNATDPTPLPVGVYNAFQSTYPGFTTTSSTNNVTTTWLGSTSSSNVPNLELLKSSRYGSPCTYMAFLISILSKHGVRIWLCAM